LSNPKIIQYKAEIIHPLGQLIEKFDQICQVENGTFDTLVKEVAKEIENDCLKITVLSDDGNTTSTTPRKGSKFKIGKFGHYAIKAFSKVVHVESMSGGLSMARFDNRHAIDTIAMDQIRTQKAAGVKLLPSILRGASHGSYVLAKFAFVIQDESGIDEFMKKSVPLFRKKKILVMARPCPIRPRHGYFESRVVHTRKELVNLLKMIQDESPEGEMLLMPYINAQFSSVISNIISIGHGTDGATGMGKTINILIHPIVLPARIKIAARFSNEKSEIPFIETVYRKGNTSTVTDKSLNSLGAVGAIPVQLRPCISPGDHLDYIAKDFVVKRIITVNEDIDNMEWERRMASLSKLDKRNLCVNIIDGSPTSHVAMQAKCHGVPAVIITRKVNIGERLKRNTTREICYDSIVRGISFSTRSNVGENDPSTIIGIFAAHHADRMCLTSEGAFLVGVGVGAIALRGIEACIGESRHWRAAGKLQIYKKCKDPRYPLSRDTIYRHLEGESQDAIMEMFIESLHAFSSSEWEGGFGGYKWRICAASTSFLLKSIDAFIKNPNYDTWGSMIGKLNNVVNICHNNGRMLTKFVPETYFDYVALRDIHGHLGFMNAVFSIIDAGINGMSINPLFQEMREHRFASIISFPLSVWLIWEKDRKEWKLLVRTRFKKKIEIPLPKVNPELSLQPCQGLSTKKIAKLKGDDNYYVYFDRKPYLLASREDLIRIWEKAFFGEVISD